MQLQSGDILVQMRVRLPFAGTWRVTAGLEQSMLIHIGDLVAVDSAARVSEQRVSSSLPTMGQLLPAADLNVLLQHQRVQLPEAIESDDDELLAPFGAPSLDGQAGAPCGVEDIGGVEFEYMLCVQGAGLVNVGSENSAGERAEAALSYTHSGEYDCP
jgi:hypothetical protein